MENLRDNNYGYELPGTIFELIEEYEEDQDEEKIEALDKILDMCDHTDLEMLSNFNSIDELLNTYERLRDDSDALLEYLLNEAQK